MPDNFSNARPYFDVTFPSSGDSFSIQAFRNAFAGLGFMDNIPLQPRAHNPANFSIMVRGQDASQFYNPVYFGNADQRIPFSSGDTPNFPVPASNPRIDIVYVTPSGDIKVQQGTEAVVPTLPSLAPSGDTRFPVAAVWCKVGMTKVVNFEDKDSNSGDGYIYKDLRPWMRAANPGSFTLSSGSTTPITGDSISGVSTAAARIDHHHQGVHTVKVVGSGDLYGDIEITGHKLQQQGNRITFPNPAVSNIVTNYSTAIFTLASGMVIGSTPINTDGTAILSATINKIYPGSKVRIIISCMSTNSGANNNIFFALFNGGNVNSFWAAVNEQGSTSPEPNHFETIFDPQAIGNVTINFRASCAATAYINGDGAGAAILGGRSEVRMTLEEVFA